MPTTKAIIGFFDAKEYDRTSFDEFNRAFGFEIRYFEARLTPVSAELARGCDAVCAFVNDDLGAETVGRLATLGVRLLAMRCAGYNNVDLPAAFGRLAVVRVPGYSPHAIAEYTMGLILCLNRRLHRAFCRVRENNFSINGLLGFDLFGKTIGVIGTGKIGATFVRLLSGFGMRILGSDPYENRLLSEETSLQYVPLDTLYAESDIISLHCPLTPENLYLIHSGTIAKMKRGVMLINTSRGKLVQTSALIEGLKNGRIGSAGLDVYEEETDFFFEDRSDAAIQDDTLARLLTFPNVLVTSHQAFFTREAIGAIAQTTLENVRAFFTTGETPNGICISCEGGKCVACPRKKD